MTGKNNAKLIVGPVKVYGYHGVFDEEKILGKEFEVIVEFFTDISRLCETDDLTDSVDYTEIVDIIKSHFKDKRYNLLEKCAFEIKKSILLKYCVVSELRVKIIKKWPSVENVECFIVEV